jgi:hypothetical protein
MAHKPGSILSATVWMFLLSVLLFWLPVLGPLIAGFVGGKKAGSLGNAVLAAILPGLVVGGIIFFSASLLTGFPLFGFIAGAGAFALMAAHVLPLIVGAAIGTLV